MNLYSVLPPMVAKLENTLRSVMLSGQDWMFRNPKRAQMQKDTRLNLLTTCNLHGNGERVLRRMPSERRRRDANISHINISPCHTPTTSESFKGLNE